MKTKQPLLPGDLIDGNRSGPLSRRAFLGSGSAFLGMMHLSKLRAAGVLAEASTAPLPLCLVTSHTKYPPLLERFISKLDPANDDFICERYIAEIEPMLERWKSSLCSLAKGKDIIAPNLSSSLHACNFQISNTVPLRSNGPLKIQRIAFPGPALIGREEFLTAWGEYLAALTSIDSFEMEIYGIRLSSELQNNSGKALSVDTDIRYSFVGNMHDGTREQRSGAWHLSWDKSATDASQQMLLPEWTVRAWASDAEVRSQLTGAGFIEISGQCLPAGTPAMAQLTAGIDDWRTVIDGASGIDVYGNHGVAVGDIDGSGFDSFYVCQPSGLPNRLLRNRGDGTFEDITETSRTGILDGSACALFVDFQNRGVQDLLVVRAGGPLLFVNDGRGRFEPRPDAFHFSRAPQGTFTSAAAADYNRDGFLDVYFCVYNYYKGLNHHQYPSPYYDAQNGPPNFLFRNRGDGTFEDVTARSGMDRNNSRFSFAAAWCDYDNDGWPDIYVANDFGRKNLYRNNGDGTFTDIAAKAGVEDYGPGMSTCWTDIDNDGLQDVYVANMWLAEGKRITADDQFLPGVDPAVRAIYQKHNAGNSMYRNRRAGTFEDKTTDAGTAMCGWSWSCAAWDFDNDGWSDLYVANGFVSAPDRHDLQSFFWRQVAQRSLTPQGASPDYEVAWNAINELVRSDYSWSGYQRNVFFANNRDGSFSEAAGVLGLDLIDDGRAFALSDIDHDGRLEIVVKNRTSPQVRVLRNELQEIGNSISIRLRGHASNRDAIGAVVTIEAGAPRQTKFVSAGSGFASQHTKELSFGLGEATQPISISVRWPTGKTDHYNVLPVNHRIQIEEGDEQFKSSPYMQALDAAPSVVAASARIAPQLASETISTWLLAPLFGPDLRLIDLNGNIRQLSALQGHLVLLTFIQAGCGDSRRQLELLEKASADLSAAGLAPFVVELTSGSDQAHLDDAFRSYNQALPISVADEHAAGPWNIQYRYLFDRRRDMAAPLSFLLDAKGAIVRIYRGVVTPQNAIDDARSVATTDADRIARALPFTGPYYGPAMRHDYLSFGIAFSEYGYDDAAQAAFQHAIDADPSLEVAWFNLGTIFLGRKMYSEARRCLSEATRLNPRDSDAWNNLGSVSGTEQKYDEALEQFTHAAQSNPNHRNAVQNMMRIYQYQGRVTDAQKAIEDLIARAPDNADLHLDLAITLEAQNDLIRARAELETSISLRAGDPDAINNLGAVLLRLGLSREALERFEECRRLAPDFDRAVINAAVIYNNEGQSDKARQILDEFLSRHPDDASVRGARNKMGRQ